VLPFRSGHDKRSGVAADDVGSSCPDLVVSMISSIVLLELRLPSLKPVKLSEQYVNSPDSDPPG